MSKWEQASKKMGNIFSPVKVNGQKMDVHIRTRVWTTQIDVSAIVLTVAITLALIALILIPIYLPKKWNKRFTWILFVIILVFTSLVFKTSKYWVYYSDGGE